MQLVISLSFVKLLWPFLRDAFHTPMIKITYTPHIFANFYTGSCASIPQNKKSMLFIAILSKLKGHELVKKMDTWRSKAFKRGRKEIWTHEGPMCFKRKLVLAVDFDDSHHQHSFEFHSIGTTLLRFLLTLTSSTSFDVYLKWGASYTNSGPKWGKPQAGRPRPGRPAYTHHILPPNRVECHLSSRSSHIKMGFANLTRKDRKA